MLTSNDYFKISSGIGDKIISHTELAFNSLCRSILIIVANACHNAFVDVPAGQDRFGQYLALNLL